MAAKYVLAALAIVFLVLAATRFARDGRRMTPASKSWLLVGAIFLAVSLWLFASSGRLG
jgi:uncharacterized membrane protein YoaK (UPF0700 family)